LSVTPNVTLGRWAATRNVTRPGQPIVGMTPSLPAKSPSAPPARKVTLRVGLSPADLPASATRSRGSGGHWALDRL